MDTNDLLKLSPEEFERLVGRVFESMGYSVNVVGKPGDEGVDIRITRGDEHSVVQCKRYAGTVDQSEIRDFFGVMQHEQADRGYLVTSGTFSLSASTWAGGKGISLVDGVDLVAAVENTDVGMPIQARLLSLPL